MTWLTGPAVLLLGTLHVLFAQDKVSLEVRYAKETINPSRGSSVKLSCNVHYDYKQCGLLHAVWCHITNQIDELTDHRKYFSTVNETTKDDIMRHRQIVTEILDLTPEDDGRYQCKAECRADTAMGHFITITVKG
ncbi:uncharacterized protein zgc:174945 [Centropristis striata]|uniref:uncharacterized protein zgc:174945 n=1 Tax=Centropristis striata TaxID=184440 RepID=UPI0027E15852|nr:uncharacterized protein zgc:174945 [Centropristis striata]